MYLIISLYINTEFQITFIIMKNEEIEKENNVHVSSLLSYWLMIMNLGTYCTPFRGVLINLNINTVPSLFVDGRNSVPVQAKYARFSDRKCDCLKNFRPIWIYIFVYIFVHLYCVFYFIFRGFGWTSFFHFGIYFIFPFDVLSFFININYS